MATLATATLPCACAWTHCTHDYHGDLEITPGTYLTRPATRVGSVKAHKWVVSTLFGLIDLTDDSGAELVADGAVDCYGEGVVGVTQVEIVEQRYLLPDVLWMLTFGLFSCHSLTASGEVHTAPDVHQGGDS
ncbi:MAG: hypothetical protein IPM29_25070 [Planctomycetes bacterium]|nr:hypothetical protein [Planctomycetota bacterium]